MVRTAVGADHIEIESDATKPDGTPRKLLDLGRLNATGWRSHMKSEDGLRLTCADYPAQFDRQRTGALA